MIHLTLDPNGDTATASLTRYMGRDRFEAYRQICYAVGARYVPADRANRMPIGAVPQFLDEIDRAGFGAEIDDSIAVRIREMADEAKELLEAGRARLQACRDNLTAKGLSLFRYQETGIEWLAPRDRAMLTDEMGLGKTVQALLALPDDAAALIVVPTAVRHNWAREIERWRPDLTPTTIRRRDHFRYPATGEAVIVSWGMLPDVEAVPTPPSQITLIGDEAHAVKNRKAKRTQRFLALKDTILANHGRVWLITGTPLLNRPPELWALLQAANLAEDAFGGWYGFCRAFGGSRGSYGYEWGKPCEDVPDLLRKVMLHRRRADVLKDLPGKIRTDIEVNDLDARTIALCDEVMTILEAKGVDLTDLSEGVEATAIEGAAFEQMSAARAALATAKIPALLELVTQYEDAEEPLVVFSYHRAPIDALGERDGWATITGSTPADERGRIVEAFQAGRLKGIAGTIAAMGVGVTLTHAHHLIMVDLAWTPALNCQAEDRVCRIGQTQGVQITRMIANHALDRRVIELLTRKQEIIEASVEASAVDADHLGTSPAEQLAETHERMNGRVADLEARSREIAEENARKHEAARAQFTARLGDEWDGRDFRISQSGKSRGPANAKEEFAGEAIIRLAALDPDRARELNGMGFSARDGEIGHSLAAQYAKYGVLSDKQWAIAKKLAIRYSRQVGTMPKE